MLARLLFPHRQETKTDPVAFVENFNAQAPIVSDRDAEVVVALFNEAGGPNALSKIISSMHGSSNPIVTELLLTHIINPYTKERRDGECISLCYKWCVSEAIRALCTCDYSASIEEKLIDTLCNQDDENRRFYAASALRDRSTEPAQEALKRVALTDPDSSVRAEAARGIIVPKRQIGVDLNTSFSQPANTNAP